MKLLKSAILAAAATSVVAFTGSASAVDLKAGDVNFSVYGRAHVSLDSVNNGSNSTLVLASNSSRLGVKASSEIADGLTALLQYEVGVDLSGSGTGDDGNGGDFQSGNNHGGLFTSARDSFIGLKGGFGMILAGNLPAINQYLYEYNLFADQVGDLGNIWGGGSYVGVDRAEQTIAYFIPDVIPGLSGDIAYVTDLNTANNGNKITGQLVKLAYSIQGLKISGTYVGVKMDTTTPSTKATDIAVVASYKINGLSVGAGYLQTKVSGPADNKRKSFTVGASYTVSGATLKAQYTQLKDDTQNSNATQIAIGADYNLGKNTSVYVAYASTNNDSSASYSANDWGHGKAAYGGPSAAGKDPNAISIGLAYNF